MANDTPELNDDSEQFYLWVRVISSTLALASVVLGRRWTLIRIAACQLTTKRMSGVVVRDGTFIRRLKEQDTLLTALKSPNHETVFVYGPRGSGKRSLIRHALMGRQEGEENSSSSSSTGVGDMYLRS
jgi:hypothetical protein